MSVAFNGIDSQVVTFQASTGQAGDTMAMDANHRVKMAPGGAAPVGILLNKRCGHGPSRSRGTSR